MQSEDNLKSPPRPAARVTVPDLRLKKSRGERIVMLTAYDCPTARIADDAGVDAILVGDSVGMTMLGYDSTLPVTMEEMLHHVRAVRRGVQRALLVADMPFGSFQASVSDTVRNAVLLMQAGAQAVKVEGAAPVLDAVRRLTSTGIPVVGHLGLTPQSVNAFGGHKAQGADLESAQRLTADAAALQEAGACSIVLETIPAELARQISASLQIPTIGIGAGPGCDGQVQVWHDILGITPGRKFRHTKRYAQLGDIMHEAVAAYALEVREQVFPTKEHSL